MSEKIAQLNEEIIRGQIKKLVRSIEEETLNELLEKESPDAGGPLRAQRGSPRLPQWPLWPESHYDTWQRYNIYCRVSKARSLRRATLSGIVAERAAWRKPSSRCIRQEPMCAVWRTSPKPCEAARSRPPSSVN